MSDTILDFKRSTSPFLVIATGLKDIESVLGRLPKCIADLLPELPEGAVIAGGSLTALRRSYDPSGCPDCQDLGDKLPVDFKDVDIFFFKPVADAVARLLVARGYEPAKKSAEGCEDWVPKSGGPTVQLSLPGMCYTGVDHVLDGFDFTMVQLGLTGGPEPKLFAGVRTLNDIDGHHLIVHRIDSRQRRTRDRIVKYMRKGYVLDSDSFLKFCKSYEDSFLVVEVST